MLLVSELGEITKSQRRNRMNLSDNHIRAKKMVESWPSWKKDVSLTIYSNQPSNNVVKTTGDNRKTNYPKKIS